MAVPYTFGTATAAIPLSQLDSNFATAITIGNTAVQLGNTITTLSNVTLTNATITSLANVTLSNATISSLSTPITAAQGGTGLTTLTANNVVLGNGTNNVQLVAPGTTGNVLVSNGTTWISNAAVGQTYPGAGIANSTGSAWGTSYTTNGTGTTVALTTSPNLTTPVLGTPTSGNLTNCTADGTNGVGYINIPVNPQTGNYTLVAGDAGKSIYHALGSANATYTIPANSSVSYINGTAVSFVNLSANAVTIAITTDTMYLSSAGTTGSRTLAQYGSATALKLANTTWIISGSGLT
jgi:hypothetical protein